MNRVDIFCRVIDNYGDIGVCWRLARQLANEHARNVRLFVDDLAAFCFIAPKVNPALLQQSLDNVVVHPWHTSIALAPADVVIEAFACDPPDAYVAAMATRAAVTQQPVWINLEYLSAEAWVDGVHGLPSPHPRLPLIKFFFCPGFSAASGGLIRERTLQPPARPQRGNAAPLANTTPTAPLQVFAFAYPHAPVRAVATALTAQVTAAAPLADHDRTWSKASPVPQTEFDRLLQQFDMLVVRGEDSFVRAQYAGKPMLWHIYPTPDDAHWVKLDAWLDRYCAELEPAAAAALRSAHRAFNLGVPEPSAYAPFARHWPTLNAHATRWRDHLWSQSDLATRLVDFIALKEKQKAS